MTRFILFPLMGRNYDAVVIASGIGGVILGSTSTEMADMAAVTQRFGPSHQAVIIVPLVSDFFIDMVNALVIPLVGRAHVVYERGEHQANPLLSGGPFHSANAA